MAQPLPTSSGIRRIQEAKAAQQAPAPAAGGQAPPPPVYQPPPPRGEMAAVWIQTVVMGLVCTGALVLYHKIFDAQGLAQRIAPLFANLLGATLLVGLLQHIRRKGWSWPLVGLVILLLASMGIWLTMKLERMIAGQV